MSLYSEYVMEREGNSVLEEPWGFLEYRLAPPVMVLESIYVRPEARRQGKGSELTERVTQIAREASCTTLWSQVWVGALNATDSLAAHLAYGFTVVSAGDNRIILTKDVGGQRG